MSTCVIQIASDNKRFWYDRINRLSNRSPPRTAVYKDSCGVVASVADRSLKRQNPVRFNDQLEHIFHRRDGAYLKLHVP